MTKNPSFRSDTRYVYSRNSLYCPPGKEEFLGGYSIPLEYLLHTSEETDNIMVHQGVFVSDTVNFGVQGSVGNEYCIKNEGLFVNHLGGY